MPRLLIVHHTPSPSMHAMFDAVRTGARDRRIEGVEVVERPALGATEADVLAADGLVLGSPANLGYLSGALKHFFDTIYYPCLESTVGRPFAAYLHGNNDTTGAERALDTITTGLQWKVVQAPVCVVGDPTAHELAACRELGASVAAGLALDAS